MMSKNRIVIDTNVLVAALMSRRGKAFILLSMIGQGAFDVYLSPTLVFEYEDVLKRLIGSKIHLSEEDIDIILDYLCASASHQKIYYLWRPFLRDPKDDMVLELAVSGECQFIVTYNINDFKGVQQFGVEALSPLDFLTLIGVT
jgi:putative PIN family toxin of toxin-antitoxin system